MDDLRDLTLADIGRDLREGRTSAREVAARASSHNRLGAYREVDVEATLALAANADAAFREGVDLGPLQGIPLSIKDLYGVPGWSTWAGSPRPLPNRFEVAGPVVQAALAQRAVVTGKTHTVEFAFGGLGTNPHHQTPINPWDAVHHRAPGGSTAGGGVSLCEGSAVIALGTDTAGSVRIPAAWTGTTAIKPTHGRWSLDGIVPLSPSLDTAGLMARRIDDLILAFEALDGPRAGVRATVPPDPSTLRFGRCDPFFFEECSPGVVEAIDAAQAELVAAGVEVVAVDLPELRGAHDLFRLGGPVSAELARFLTFELPDWLETLDPNVGCRIADATTLPAVEYLERLETLKRLAAAVDARFNGVDVMIGPTVANSPPLLSDLRDPERYRAENLLCLRNTGVVSYLGLCAVSLPVGLDALGLPVGLQLIGRGGEDLQVLSIASACERVLGAGPERLGLPPRH